ncbi:MAG: hypothetical protein ACHQXJ_03145 [Nitrososphaerales archaeon]
MKQFLFLIALILVSSFLVSGMSASAQSTISHHCTASQPCVDICGDHVCAPGELAQMKAKSAPVINNTTTASTSAVSIPSTGVIVGGVVSYMDVASDGTAVIVRTGHPLSGQTLAIGLAFRDSKENFVQDQNYAITVTQDNNVILSNPTGYTHSGTDSLTTVALSSNNPVNIQVTLNGVGPPTAAPSTWTGVKGEVLLFSQVSEVKTPLPASPIANMTNATSASVGNAPVPEFGSIAGVIIAISVIGSLMISKRFGKF